MKEESRYYTPTIEEFHVGFEYEIWDDMNDGDYQWFPTIFGGIIGKLSALQYSVDITVVNNILNQGGIRVKYLDREDIESLGFKYLGRGDREIYVRGEWELQTFVYPVFQVRVTNNVGSTRFFNGELKNKSELKRILKQIGV